MYKNYEKAVLLGAAVCAGGAFFYRWNMRMPLRDYTRYALYMAVLDDEICRNELEGNQIEGSTIVFPPKSESLQYRYHLFLKSNRKKSRKELLSEIRQMKRRLTESRAYREQAPCNLDVEISPEVC